MLVKKAEEFPATNCDQDVTSESAEALESNILVVEGNSRIQVDFPSYLNYLWSFAVL